MWKLQKWSSEQLVMISQQMSHLLNHGVTLIDSIEMLIEQKVIKRELGEQISYMIRQGNALSSALQEYEFPELFVSFIRIAEEHGDYAHGFACCHQYYYEKHTFQQEMIHACIYPLVVLVCICLAMGFILPRFTELYQSLDVELPLLTRLIIMVSNRMDIGLYMMLFLLAMCLWIFLCKRYQIGNMDRWFVHFPILRFIYRYRFTHYFSIQLGSLIQAGVPLLKSLELMEKLAPWTLFAHAIQQMKHSLVIGQSLETDITLDQKKYFLSTLPKMVAIGEKTGTLDQALLNLGKATEILMKNYTQRWVKGLEPLLIFMLGIGILLIVLAMFLPMMQLIEVI